MKEISDKDRQLAEEYLKCWNGAEAARRTGTSSTRAKVRACEVLNKPAVKAYIEERVSQL